MAALAGRKQGRGRRRTDGGRWVALGVAVTAALLTAAPASNAAYAAPDPGGNEAASVRLPPNGKLFGFNEGVWGVAPELQPRHFLELSRTAGGNMIRSNLDWRHAEPQQDAWDERWWSRWKQLYDAARGRGMKVIFIIGSAPPWARASEHQDCVGFGACEFPPAHEMDGEWAEYAAEVAKRFPDALIEVWNEPNLRYFWDSGADPERWAELQASAYDAIKAVSPQTEVIAGGLSNNQTTGDGHMALREFLHRAYAADPSIEGHMDYLGLHPYPQSGSFGANTLFAKSFDDVRSVREANGDDAPLFVTEVGLSTAKPESLTEDARAEAALRLYRRLMTMADVKGAAFHRLVAPAGASAWNSGAAWTLNGGSPTAPKPVYCRFVAEARRSYPLCPGTLALGVEFESTPGPVVDSTSARFAFESPSYDAHYQCSVDGAPFSLCWSPWNVEGLGEGDHSFAVRAIDGTDGSVQARPIAHRFRVDFTPADDPNVVDDTTGDAGTQDEAPRDDSTVTDDRVPEADDAGGTAAPRPTADTRAPVIQVRRARGRRGGLARPRFAFWSDESITSLRCRIDRRPFGRCSGRFTHRIPARMPRGIHCLEVRGTDRSGNVGSARRRFKVRSGKARSQKRARRRGGGCAHRGTR